MTSEALKLLRRIHSAYPSSSDAAYDDPTVRELRDLDFIYLWDMGQHGESRWMATNEGQAALAAGAVA